MPATAIRCMAKKPKPKMKPIELKTPPEQTQTITRVIFDILKEHGPLTIADTWEHVKEVGLKGLTSKRHMKIVLRWMRERSKLKLICNHVGPHKQFLYTTWFTKPASCRQDPMRTLQDQGHNYVVNQWQKNLLWCSLIIKSPFLVIEETRQHVYVRYYTFSVVLLLFLRN